MGKLIVLEGVDCSGKSTQFRMLCEKLTADGLSFRKLTFPRYSEPSSELIKMYLGGSFGSNPSDVNPYAASTFFAVDRFASYAQDWRGFYEDGGILLTDRYTTSNAIHQGAKIPPEKRGEFFRWLYDFEFGLMGIPAPDAVKYLQVTLDIALRRIRSRAAKTGTEADIHESDAGYLRTCIECGEQAAASLGWTVVPCVKDGIEREREEQNLSIYNIVRAALDA
jgi:dTMP kinase